MFLVFRRAYGHNITTFFLTHKFHLPMQSLNHFATSFFCRRPNNCNNREKNADQKNMFPFCLSACVFFRRGQHVTLVVRLKRIMPCDIWHMKHWKPRKILVNRKRKMQFMNVMKIVCVITTCILCAHTVHFTQIMANAIIEKREYHNRLTDP